MRIALRTKMLRIYIVMLVLMKSVCANVYPPQIASQASSLHDDQHHNKQEAYDAETKKALTNQQESTGFKDLKEKNQVVGQDAGNYSQENASKNQHHDRGQKQGEDFHRSSYDSVNQSGRKGGHRKGHHKSGYHNSYHKDESENNSSYYDDNDDQAGHFVYDSRNGAAAQSGSDKFSNSFDNGRYDNKHNNRNGYYDVGGNYNNEKNDRHAYNDRQFYNDRRDKINSNSDNIRGQSGRNYNQQQEKQYQQQFYPRFQPKKTITIYEDPRFENNPYPLRRYPHQNEPRYDSGNIYLDFRRRPLPFNQRPIYDFYK